MLQFRQATAQNYFVRLAARE